MKQLLNTLNTLEQKINNSEMLNKKVSASSVGWHISHVLLSHNSIIDAIVKSNPKEFKPAFSIKKMVVFGLGKLPRGRKAPERVMPKDVADKETLTNGIGIAKQKLNALVNLPQKHFFTHPVFGKLKVNDTIKFLTIHANHHIKIIDQIINSELS